VYDPSVSRKKKPLTLARPKSTPTNATSRPGTVSLHNQIRERAYELYESRGKENGNDEQDWLRAEQEFRTHQR
jgi:hypothetical protein